MKKRPDWFNLSVAAFLIFLISIWGCNKTSTPGINADTSTLAYVLANGTNTTIFNSAVIKAGLDSTFANPGSVFTLFVPNDQACIQSGYSQTVVNGFTVDQAKDWVLYQTYAGAALPFETFIGKTEQKLIMANGDSVFVSGDSNRTFVNGFEMLNSELTTSNGIMLAAQAVITPPTKNLSQVISSDTALTFLNQAINLATQAPDSLTTLFSTGGPFTFMAPNNDAFRKLGYNSPSDLSLANPDSLRSMILTTVIPLRLFSYDINDSSTFYSYNDSTLLFANTGIQGTVTVLNSAYTSNILTINTMARNGVLFKIDEVLDR
jgi:uncharacterized surface protein with fasciclin (FAS1) repeats